MNRLTHTTHIQNKVQSRYFPKSTIHPSLPGAEIMVRCRLAMNFPLSIWDLEFIVLEISVMWDTEQMTTINKLSSQNKLSLKYSLFANISYLAFGCFGQTVRRVIVRRQKMPMHPLMVTEISVWLLDFQKILYSWSSSISKHSTVKIIVYIFTEKSSKHVK